MPLEMDENELKAKLIDYLLNRSVNQTESGPGFMLINELPFCDGKRRADIVEVGLQLNAYEIKSDVDSLYRLPEQIQDYKDTFDTVTLVTTRRHVQKARSMCSSRVGIILVECAKVSLVRTAKPYRRFNNYALSSLLRRNDLERLLREQGVHHVSRYSTSEKRHMVAKLITTSLIKQEVIRRITAQYKLSFNRFIDHKGDITMCDDLQLFFPSYEFIV